MKASGILLFMGLCWANPATAQITVSTLTEMQHGEVPGSDTTSISTSYNQINIDAIQKGFQAGFRAEIYNAPGIDRQVYEITQKYARWNHGGFRLEVGNYNAILGRGLTLRAFELPGVVLESSQYRLRYPPTQDSAALSTHTRHGRGICFLDQRMDRSQSFSRPTRPW